MEKVIKSLCNSEQPKMCKKFKAALLILTFVAITSAQNVAIAASPECCGYPQWKLRCSPLPRLV
jgi:hypothetical protein